MISSLYVGTSSHSVFELQADSDKVLDIIDKQLVLLK